MNFPNRVATPPARPVLIYDGDCRFCTLWIRRWEQVTGDAVEYLPSQDPQVTQRFPEIPGQEFATAVQLIETDGRVFRGAEAVFRSLATNPRHGWLLRRYAGSPAFARGTEHIYRLVARHRPFFSLLTRLAFGSHVARPQHIFVRWMFLRALGLIYLIAFLSLWTQVDGLIGSKGILPVDQLMAGAHQYVKREQIGMARFQLLPTLCWWNAGDGSLHAHCAAGAVLALLLILGIAPAPCLFLLWLIYLSLSVVAREFLGFQWDILLLETGFLAIFLAPRQLWPRLARELPPPRLAVWLLRLLLFKLMFQSGCVKLASGDSFWRDLTALAVHYETQPLPTWLGWYAHQLPLWIQKLSCFVMFVMELVVPFLIFAPRKPRQLAAALLALLQLLILCSGNYTFFNWLTLALCVLLLDDVTAARFASARVRALFVNRAPDSAPWSARVAAISLAVIVIPITALQLLGTIRSAPAWLAPVAAVHGWLAPFRSLNSYGLFAVMTRTRPEIVIEGSDDGMTWRAYEFKHKPGDLARRPAFVAPHQPRLDWQLWFAALGRAAEHPWFVNLCERLLQGSPPVLALLGKNPFPAKPPRYIRATLYEYHFTDFAERRRTGNWWRREFQGLYLPVLAVPSGAAGDAR